MSSTTCSTCAPTERKRISRRAVLKSAGAIGTVAIATPGFGTLTFAPNNETRVGDIVNIFLSGGMDGLSSAFLATKVPTRTRSPLPPDACRRSDVGDRSHERLRTPPDDGAADARLGRWRLRQPPRTPPRHHGLTGPSGLRAISLPHGQRSLSGSGIAVTLDRTDDFRVEGFRSNGKSGAAARAALQDLHAVAASKVLAAFARDLGSDMARVTAVVTTEFGRTFREDGGLGVDHGRASTMFVMGGGIQGGLYGNWPGLTR